MLSKGSEAHHRGRECVIVESSYLGVRIQYLDDETFLFVPASRVISEVIEQFKKSDIKHADDKRLPLPNSHPPRPYHFDRSAMSKASKKMHDKKRKANSQ